MPDMKKIDLHTHSTVSDGTDTPPELLQHVREAKIALFALTDHDSVRGCAMIRDIRTEGDPKMLTGVEFSCRDEHGKYHILGYNFDPDSPSITEIIELGHRYRMTKLMKRISFIRDRFGFSFSEEDIQSLLALDNPGKPHIGNLMVQYGYAPSRDTAISEYLNQMHFPDEYVRPEAAVQSILAGGGIPVLAHPAYGSGEELIMGPDMDRRLRRLISFGLQGVEAFYSAFPPKLIAETLSFARKYNLYVTAGSDYHGKNKLISLGDTNLDEGDEMPDGFSRFLEAVHAV